MLMWTDGGLTNNDTVRSTRTQAVQPKLHKNNRLKFIWSDASKLWVLRLVS